MKGYRKLRKVAFNLLSSQLSDKLTYHGIDHTMDVLKRVNFYIRHYEIGHHEAQLLRIGALFHDIGFTQTYQEHEAKGVEILKSYMDEFGCQHSDFIILKGIIMATKIPQSPHHLLEHIICDADLDYLGRGRYYEIGETLYKEWRAFDLIKNRAAWNTAQINFLKHHSYYTDYAREKLQPKKERRIKELNLSHA